MASHKIMQKLETLQCEYYGPLQGRNRNRVFNHVNAVSDRLKIVEEIRVDENCLDVLTKHFYNEISTDEATNQIVKSCERSQIDISIKRLESFVHRYHVEFHPCDACNLRCNGCTYFQDTKSKPEAVSFPFEQIAKICSVIQPKAITIVGGGEPLLYNSGEKRLGDLICALGNGEFDCTPAIGLITNGTLWPPGNPHWHHYVQWIRYSLDASTTKSYTKGKGKNYFDNVVDNIFRSLTETNIPQVGVGFIYHPGNIAEAGLLVSLFANRLREICPDQIHRLNIQFRPWRAPTGRPSIKERILSSKDIDEASAILFNHMEQDSTLEQFIQQNTNIAVNLLCGGAREKVKPFSECLFGLAKTVIRANGSLYPCFRVAASEEPLFYCGNITADEPLKIALKELYVTIVSVKQICIPEYDKCLFCVFNDMLEAGLASETPPWCEFREDFFF